MNKTVSIKQLNNNSQINKRDTFLPSISGVLKNFLFITVWLSIEFTNSSFVQASYLYMYCIVL